MLPLCVSVNLITIIFQPANVYNLLFLCVITMIYNERPGFVSGFESQ